VDEGTLSRSGNEPSAFCTQSAWHEHGHMYF
jgi:hypothetical protein